VVRLDGLTAVHGTTQSIRVILLATACSMMFAANDKIAAIARQHEAGKHSRPHTPWRWSALACWAPVACFASVAVFSEATAGTHEYVQYFIGVLLLVQAALIVGLCIQARLRREAECNAQRLHSDMTHAARLALAGELTATIAHEVTQPLSAILSNVETAELLLADPQNNAAAIAEILADIKRDDLRAHEIIKRLRTLLRKRELTFERMDINGMIENAVALVRPETVQRGVALTLTLDGGLPHLEVDPVHLQQVLLNLFMNGMDAMRDVPPTRRQLDIQSRRHDAGSVEIVVTDSGHGMTDEQLTRAFESFFTTKEGGMGLGLSIARSIVRSHGGSIGIEQRQSGGTIFRITLPVRRSLRQAAHWSQLGTLPKSINRSGLHYDQA
jgi:signal transduction histidine kinase